MSYDWLRQVKTTKTEEELLTLLPFFHPAAAGFNRVAGIYTRSASDDITPPSSLPLYRRQSRR